LLKQYNAVKFIKITVIILVIIIADTQFLNSAANNNAEYKTEIQNWQEKRINSLTKTDGWLSLTGLFWLEEGKNSFGASEENMIIFPGKNVPAKIGYFILESDSVVVQILPEIEVFNESNIVKKIKMIADIDGNKTVLRLGSLSWFVLKRGDKYGIRLRDSENQALKNFKGIQNFPVNIKWRIKAKLETYDPPKKIKIPTVLGTEIEQTSPGVLVFDINNKTYRLEPTGEKSDEELFLVFGDVTNGWETYGGGRFLYVNNVDSTGYTYIDFNKAYNPPCAFTDYATCPLPPAQNKIKVRIEAGEKKYEGFSH